MILVQIHSQQIVEEEHLLGTIFKQLQKKNTNAPNERKTMQLEQALKYWNLILIANIIYLESHTNLVTYKQQSNFSRECHLYAIYKV